MTTKPKPTPMQLVWEFLLFCLLCIATSTVLSNDVLSSDDHALGKDIIDLPLEDLLDMKVSTVSRKEQDLKDVSAAVFVISQEDIRRSSANSIPELLRMAPGLSVARLDANKWSVTSRGDSGRFADDMLVMIDGRSAFSPLFAGTFWETIDVPLEDIDRIEIIRGPSGTIWGANAANGAIHIVTKQAKNTQGSLVTLGGGTEERGFATLRYGGQIGEDLHYRIFSKGFTRDNSFSPNGADDNWRMGTLGFRADWDVNSKNEVSLQGQYYSGKAGQNTSFISPQNPQQVVSRIEDANLSGGHALLRWQHNIDAHSNTVLQMYYDRMHRDELSYRDTRNTVDVDFQHRFLLYKFFHQDIVWGGGYRWTGDNTGSNLPISFSPVRRDIQTGNVFVQNDIQLIANRLRFSTGIKFLHNTYTREKFLPNARLMWTPNSNQSIWTSVTRAVRVPSRFELEGNQIIKEGAEFLRRISNPNVVAETLWAYETGYRHQVTDDLSVDIAGFYNDFNHSESEQEVAPGIITSSDNGIRSQVYGFEVFGEWRMLRQLRFMPSYSYLRSNIEIPLGHEAESGEDPTHQFSLRSQLEITHNIELDAFFRYIDSLPGLEIDSYKALDLRLGWRPVSNVELSLVGRNLLQSHHQEFEAELIRTVPVQIQRSVFGKVTWRF